MWLELIKVRVPEAYVEYKSVEFWETLSPPQSLPGLDGYDLYTNASHPNEVMLALRWSSSQAVDGGSDLARTMAERLKAHGLVSRSAWMKKSTDTGQQD
jgi:hypothetical protein